MRRNNTLQVCQACGKEVPQLNVCAKCQCSWYCGKACQVKDWPTHRKHCTSMDKVSIIAALDLVDQVLTQDMDSLSRAMAYHWRSHGIMRVIIDSHQDAPTNVYLMRRDEIPPEVILYDDTISIVTRVGEHEMALRYELADARKAYNECVEAGFDFAGLADQPLMVTTSNGQVISLTAGTTRKLM